MAIHNPAGSRYWPDLPAPVQERNARWMTDFLAAEGLTTIEGPPHLAAGHFCLATLTLAPCLNQYGECGEDGERVVPVWALGSDVPAEPQDATAGTGQAPLYLSDGSPNPVAVHEVMALWDGWRVDTEEGWVFQAASDTELPGSWPLDVNSRQALALEVIAWAARREANRSDIAGRHGR